MEIDRRNSVQSSLKSHPLWVTLYIHITLDERTLKKKFYNFQVENGIGL